MPGMDTLRTLISVGVLVWLAGAAVAQDTRPVATGPLPVATQPADTRPVVVGEPANEPATVPDDGPVDPREIRALSSPLPLAGSVEEGLELTRAEKTMFEAIRQGGDVEEVAFYLVLRRAAALPQLPAEQFDRLDIISAENLLNRPKHYVAQPLRMRVAVWAVRELKSGGGLGGSAYWPRKRSVWLVLAQELPTGRELALYSLVNPVDILGKPDKTDSDGTLKYPARDMLIAGVFYKTTEAPRTDGKGTIVVPVIAVWQMKPSVSLEPLGTSKYGWYAAGLALLIIVYFVVRRVLKRPKAAPLAKYRDVMERLKAERQVDKDARDAAVDEKLRQAAQEYRKEKGHDDADRKG